MSNAVGALEDHDDTGRLSSVMLSGEEWRKDRLVFELGTKFDARLAARSKQHDVDVVRGMRLVETNDMSDLPPR